MSDDLFPDETRPTVSFSDLQSSVHKTMPTQSVLLCVNERSKICKTNDQNVKTIEDLPDSILMRILKILLDDLYGRHICELDLSFVRAMQVCTRWDELGCRTIMELPSSNGPSSPTWSELLPAAFLDSILP